MRCQLMDLYVSHVKADNLLRKNKNVDKVKQKI